MCVCVCVCVCVYMCVHPGQPCDCVCVWKATGLGGGCGEDFSLTQQVSAISNVEGSILMEASANSARKVKAVNTGGMLYFLHQASEYVLDKLSPIQH